MNLKCQSMKNLALMTNYSNNKTKIYSMSTNLEKSKRLTMKCLKYYGPISSNKKWPTP